MSVESIWRKLLISFKSELLLLLPTSLFQVVYLSFSGFLAFFLYRPMMELDFFWRVLIGDSLRSNLGVEPDKLPTWGNYDASWTTTQPLGEVLLSLFFNFGGLEFIAVGRIVVWVFLVWWVYRFLLTNEKFQLTRASTQFRVTIYSLSSIYLLLPYIQERPQTILLVQLLIVGPNLVEAFMDPKAVIKTSTWSVLFFSVFIHPAWIIIYVFLFFQIARQKILEGNRTRKKNGQKHDRGLLNLVLLLVIPALPMLGPSGSSYYLNIFEISSLGRSYISEWQPLWKMDLSQPILYLFSLQLLLVISLGIEFARGMFLSRRILFYSLLISLQVFATVAVRNMPVAIILTISLLTVVVTSTKSNSEEFNRNEIRAGSSSFSKIEDLPVYLRLIPMVFIMSSLVLSIFNSFRATEDFAKIAPVKIMVSLKELEEAKVLNSSNEGSYIHYFAGESVYPFVDGRIDRYTRDQLDLLDELFSSKTGTKQLKRVEFDQATDILIPQEYSLRPKKESGFRFICQENGFLWFSRQARASCAENMQSDISKREEK